MAAVSWHVSTTVCVKNLKNIFCLDSISEAVKGLDTMFLYLNDLKT